MEIRRSEFVAKTQLFKSLDFTMLGYKKTPVELVLFNREQSLKIPN